MINEEKYRIIRDEIREMVKQACFAPENFFTDTVWDCHILPVVEHSLALGKNLKADQQVLELASLLHDYAAILDKDLYAEHHEHGARLAGDILAKYSIEPGMIEHIKKCIYSHRGSNSIAKQSLEAEILASADAMSHITQLADMFYLTYGVHKYKTREGARWLFKKLNRSWAKIMPAGREMIQNEYNIALDILNKAIK